jgi:hypothetical protein
MSEHAYQRVISVTKVTKGRRLPRRIAALMSVVALLGVVALSGTASARANERVAQGSGKQLDKSDYELDVSVCDGFRAGGTITNLTGEPAAFTIEARFGSLPISRTTTEVLADDESTEFDISLPSVTDTPQSDCEILGVSLAEPTKDSKGKSSEGKGSEDTEITKKDRKAFAKAPAVVAGNGLPTGPAFVKVLPRWSAANPLAKRATGGLEESPDDVVTTRGSPDGRYLVLDRNPTAVDPGSYEILDIETGDVIDTAEYDGQREQEFAWSPDSRAFAYKDEVNVYVHRVGGATTTWDRSQEGALPFQLERAVFSSDESTTTVAACVFTDLVTVTFRDDPGETEIRRHEDCSIGQLVDDAGGPVGVALLDGQVFRVDTDGTLIPTDTPVPRSPESAISPESIASVTDCGGLAIVRSSGSEYWIYSPVADTFVEVSALGPLTLVCPIASPDGEQFALQTGTDGQGPVVVGDFTTGQVAEVSRAGRPIAWSADGERILVQANGTFVVEADGSGGTEATEEIAPRPGSGGSFCRAAGTGFALLVTADGLVLFDVGENEGTPLPVPPKSVDKLARACTVTADGHWLLSGLLLVDLERGRGTPLPIRFAESGRQITDPNDNSPFLTSYMWLGEQDVTIAETATTTAN